MSQLADNVVSLADAHISRAERRRTATLFSMQCALKALSLELENIASLGDRDAAVALESWAARIDHEQARAQTLADEYRELAVLDIDEGSE
jgi:hypothetical protein